MIWIKLGVVLLSVALSARARLDEIPEDGITYKVKYPVDAWLIHAQDVGYSLQEARNLFYIRDYPATIITIANFDPEFTINFVRKDLTCYVRFTSGEPFLKASFLFLKDVKAVYKVQQNKILGMEMYEGGDELKFAMILQERGVNLTIVTHSRTSNFYWPVIHPSEIER
ncbi:hypothetical protein Ocin01_18256 [Orchesella cincta]|uniref:Uncharacterized protein n=1 Tax=Orchesella cincta TaxID=48709 RepID=A0A1D2M618_ORCCI|nr:hypothetical protein Ocin01_18256 [Orchesella cincta]